MKPRNPRIYAVIYSIVAISVFAPIMIAQAKPVLKGAIKRQEIRNEYTRFETIIDSLNITPGMTILDIGSGPGYATFLMADRLKGTGAVYSTDIRGDFVKHITDEAKKRGLTNLISTVVREEGFDDFYFKHRYDLVFLSNVYHCIDNRIEYFSKLRGQLNPNARLALILYNHTPLFSEYDFSSIEELVATLPTLPPDNPIVKNLSPTTRQLLLTKAEDEAIENALIEDFNRMLTNPQFYRNFYSASYFRKDLFTPTERELANWLLMILREDGTLEKPLDQIGKKGMRGIIKLNRMFFMKQFGQYFEKNGVAYIPGGDANRQTSKFLMLREMDAAGYKPVKEIKLSPYFDAVIMAPKTP